MAATTAESKSPVRISDIEWQRENKDFMDRTFRHCLFVFPFGTTSRVSVQTWYDLELRVSTLWDDVYHGPDAETAAQRAVLIPLLDAAMKHGVQFSYAYLIEYPELAELVDDDTA
jgi:hypothetical protein